MCANVSPGSGPRKLPRGCRVPGVIPGSGGSVAHEGNRRFRNTRVGANGPVTPPRAATIGYRGPVPRSHRIFIGVPDALASAASQLAEDAGHRLTPFLHASVITAVRAARAGHGDRLPPASLHPVPLNRGDDEKPSKVAIVASADDEDAWSAALEAQGSSLAAVVVAALYAFIKAEGSWLDTVMPGESSAARRTVGAA